jgi:hypothetical protein
MARNNDKFKCTSCNFEIDAILFQKFHYFSFDAVKFGWGYRDIYEKDLEKNGNLNSRYCVVFYYELLYECAKFIILAILSGITYDILKQKFNLFANRIQSNKKVELKNEEFEKFIQYMEEYTLNKLSCTDEVANAMLSENIIDKLEQDEEISNKERNEHGFDRKKSFSSAIYKINSEKCDSLETIKIIIEESKKYKEFS